MRCELCGKEEGHLQRVMIEGVEMMVCGTCSAYAPPRTEYYGRDIFEKMNKEIVPDWGERIRKARESRGLSRQELGAMVGEKTTTIAKIENHELRPPDEKAKKIEKVLGITLFQEVKQAVLKKKDAKKLTIGDLLKKDE